MAPSANSAAKLTRRTFLGAAAASAAAASLPRAAAGAPLHRRRNLSVPGVPKRVLDSYRKAIRAMLQLPPSDPRNWYRQALVHTIDCPHGNWWFLVWHRGYIGWFEQTCRELSGDAEFALPYWDWTKQPRVPPEMFEDVLTPADPAYIASFAEFKAKFQATVAEYWGSFSEDQIGQLLIRGLRFPDDLWFDIGYPKGPMFFDRAHARGLTKEKPDFDGNTTKSVALSTLLDALSPRDFITFASAKTMFHSGLTGFGVLEGQPHNRVHNCVGGIFTDPSGKTTDVGGFMQSNLSPVDPLFYLHHANIDRLWDVWTRKQEARGYPALPQGGDANLWSQEPFLFFTDAQGKPVRKTRAGDYATIGDFAYDYQPGSGEEVVAKPAAVAAAARPQRFAARLAAPAEGAAGSSGGSITLPSALLAGSGAAAPRLLAQVTVALPPLDHSHDFAVTLDAPSANAAPGASNPHFVATLAMFGHHIMRAPVTFTVPLTEAVAELRQAKLLNAQAPLELRVVPVAPAGALMAMPAAAQPEVLSITVESF